ncbi:type II toxin-antitoxin system VapC family toxin [Mesorhizobium sp. KR9-304]|uniref:type II toxin-antitoxin system VapC family toxin n=1 Tax=Mesorhizobium sp. KR9-304 TaxID=3156614 RepID=UPI0032B3392E
MIVIDTSVFVAIFKTEPIAPSLRLRLGKAAAAIVPATCLVEIALLRRMDERLLDWARDLVSQPPFQIVELSTPEAEIAADAARRFGKGSGHPAQLNFGDCLVYAAAKFRNVPLLIAGNDFIKTDIAIAATEDN